MFNFVNQIEVPVGRGKPPVLIEKDESLDKVNFFFFLKGDGGDEESPPEIY
jgi:hypothetical protein